MLSTCTASYLTFAVARWFLLRRGVTSEGINGQLGMLKDSRGADEGESSTGLRLGSASNPSRMRVAESNNNPDSTKLYKTEMCRSWEENGSCRYGSKCQFAHGKEELRPVARHPKYKTEVCRTFTAEGACPYGRRCRFIHPMFDSSSTRCDVPPLMSSFTRYLDDNSASATPSSKARLPVFRQICPAPSLVY